MSTKWISLQMNWIGYYENVVSDDLCDKIMDYSDNVKPLKASEYATSEGKSERSKERVKMDDGWFVNGEQYYQDIRTCFMTALKKYQEKHKDCVCQRYTDFRLNKYSEGGFMSRHIDNIHHSHGQTYGYPQLTALLMLNDNYKGGNLLFYDPLTMKEIKRYELKKGTIVFFPSCFLYPHRIEPITEGVRYSIVSWLI